MRGCQVGWSQGEGADKATQSLGRACHLFAGLAGLQDALQGVGDGDGDVRDVDGDSAAAGRHDPDTATTAKPLPIEAARAASMVALSASRFVCSAIDVISLIMPP